MSIKRFLSFVSLLTLFCSCNLFQSEIPVSGVVLHTHKVTLIYPEAFDLEYYVLPEKASHKGVVWSTSDNDVADVSYGTVFPHSLGECTITVTTVDGGFSDSCTVYVESENGGGNNSGNQGDDLNQGGQSGGRIENGHEWVDLGLSVKWADCNLGASSPEKHGDYYAWGETETKQKYNWDTYKWCNGSYDSLTKYNTSSRYGTVDNRTVMELSDDAARANWGGNWRMPTDAEWTELINNCTWTWTTVNGVYGRKVMSNKSGYTNNYIFLPASGERYDDTLDGAGSDGCFWSSSLAAGGPSGAGSLYFNSVDVHGAGGSRCYGLSIRPVTE